MLLNFLVASLVAQPLQAAPPKRPMLEVATRIYIVDGPAADSSASAKPLELNRPMPFVTYRPGAQCGFAAQGSTDIPASSTLDWSVTAVPKTITAEHVVLDVTWLRQRAHKVEARGALTVLIRPGDRVTLDVADAREPKSIGCQMSSAELTLELDPLHLVRDTIPIVSTDMWLVRRPANGQEQTQQINVRSASNEDAPFYFDEVKSGSLAMSVIGSVRPRVQENGAIFLEFWAERRLRDGTTGLDRGFTSLPARRPLMFSAPQDVVSVEFPVPARQIWKDLGADRFSIRIQTRRIR